MQYMSMDRQKTQAVSAVLPAGASMPAVSGALNSIKAE